MFEWKERIRTHACVFAVAVLSIALGACGADEDDAAQTYDNVPTALPEYMAFSDCEIADVSPAEWAASVDTLVVGTIASVTRFGPDDVCAENTVFGLQIELESLERIAGDEHGGTLTLTDAPAFDETGRFGAMAVITLPIQAAAALPQIETA